MGLKAIEYKSSNEVNAIGTSLSIMKSSGIEIFKKIHKLQMPNSGNAFSPAIAISKNSKQQISQKISRTTKAIKSSINSLQTSSKQVFIKIPKIPKTSNAMGKSSESLQALGTNLLRKVMKEPSKK